MAPDLWQPLRKGRPISEILPSFTSLLPVRSWEERNDVCKQNWLPWHADTHTHTKCQLLRAICYPDEHVCEGHEEQITMHPHQPNQFHFWSFQQTVIIHPVTDSTFSLNTRPKRLFRGWTYQPRAPHQGWKLHSMVWALFPPEQNLIGPQKEKCGELQKRIKTNWNKHDNLRTGAVDCWVRFETNRWVSCCRHPTYPQSMHTILIGIGARQRGPTAWPSPAHCDPPRWNLPPGFRLLPWIVHHKNIFETMVIN